MNRSGLGLVLSACCALWACDSGSDTTFPGGAGAAGSGGAAGQASSGGSGGAVAGAAGAATGGSAAAAGAAGSAGNPAAGGASAAGSGGEGGVAGSAAEPRCKFDASGSQALGEDCGCVEDCAASDAVCSRNALAEPTGANYCTSVCPDGNCPSGYECLSELAALGLTPFCERCAAAPGSVDLGGTCRCDSDCGTTPVGNQQRQMSCNEGECAIQGCTNMGPLRCPDGYACEGGACQQCTQASPVGEGESCGCARDCESGLSCEGDVCRKPCTGDADCGAGRECREQLDGTGLCADVTGSCMGSGSRSLGMPCTCNADCDAAAPVCIALSSESAVRVCTQRPCDLSASCGSGVGGVYQCCTVPLVMPATCIPAAAAAAFGGAALCGP